MDLFSELPEPYKSAFEGKLIEVYDLLHEMFAIATEVSVDVDNIECENDDLILKLERKNV